ncbi:hypothetical protein E2C01_011930 [Portunus trituberculatus]|uniref:Uncharacterized protein n=1 Tax=Portunus trituberculatus TaxID=210409 RepID=A0A5B7DD57_PORTR|nr:hypothetical protein [Portunus trituberculatus]
MLEAEIMPPRPRAAPCTPSHRRPIDTHYHITAENGAPVSVMVVAAEQTGVSVIPIMDAAAALACVSPPAERDAGRKAAGHAAGLFSAEGK